MLLLRFLWLFVFIVTVRARAIFKSMENDDIYQHNSNISNDTGLTNKGYYFFKYFKTQIKKVPQIGENRLEFKRTAYREPNFNDFETYESTKCPRDYHGNVLYKIVKSKSKNNKSFVENKKLIKILENANLDKKLSTELDNIVTDYSKNFFDLKSITSSYDDREIDTAEIEAILNEIKHREIEIIAEHEPSVSNLITTTVNDIINRSTLQLNKNTVPSYNSPEYSNNEKNTRTKKKYHKTKHQVFNHIFPRSINLESTILAENVENTLQNRIKNVFDAVKKKIAHDYNKEVTDTKASIKQAYKDITNKICNITKSPEKEKPQTTKSPEKECTKPPEKELPPSTKEPKKELPPPPIKPKSKNTFHKTTRELRYSHNTEKYTNLSETKKSTHTIPVLTDDFSMLTIFEQLLSKTQEQNEINILTTNIPFNEKSSGYNKISTDGNLDIIDEFEYPIANLEQQNEENYSDKALISKFDSNIESDTTTEDMSFEALSNKLSYNDYVNGYKYYLNFQKQQGDDKFSNLIRYQAHKHHKVDDIGKYILNKIPHLPTTRIRRSFVEPETLEDQDISTKSEDSWFKKHFYLFLDTDPSKKFHSTQTVTCKDLDSRKNHKLPRHSTLTPNGNKTLIKGSHNTGKNHKKSKKLEIDKMLSKSYIKYKRNIKENINKIEDINQLQKQIQSPTCSNNNNNDKPFEKYKNIPLSTRSTTIVKLQKNRKNKPIRVFHLFHRKGKEIHKREDLPRVQRFNFLKGVKDIFKDYPKYSHPRQEKLFDYEIMTSSKPRNEHVRNHFQIEEMIRQIPNITSNFETINPFFDLNYKKLIEDSLTYTKDSTLSTLPSKLSFEKIPSVDNKEIDFWLSYGTDHEKDMKFTSSPYENYKPSLPVQLDNNDLIYTDFKTESSQGNFYFPVTLPSLNKYTKINSKYRIKLATNKPKKITTTQKYDTSQEIEGHKNTYKFKPTKLSSIDKDMTKFLINLKDSTLDNSFNMLKTSEKEYSRDRAFIESKTKNNFEKYNKLPEQYFSTPLPMNIKEFNTFLREHQIDVESVTAPLRNSISFSADKTPDKWKMNKKYVPKSTTTTDETLLFQDKQYNLKVVNEKKEKGNLKSIGHDIKNAKQERLDDLKYADIKDIKCNKNAFRLTNMKTYNSFIDNTSATTKSVKYPKRVQVSGHNYKYDIIFHHMNKRNADICDYKSDDKTLV